MNGTRQNHKQGNPKQQPQNQKKIRIDLVDDEAVNLEREAGSGIWHVVVRHDAIEQKAEEKSINLCGAKRARNRELCLDQFKSV